MAHKPVFFGRGSDAVTRLLTRPLSVVETGVYRGPHYCSHTPMARLRLDLGRLEDWPTDRIEGFADALNVSADHLDLRGIDTLDQLAEVKSLITETVGRHGASVLNADDPLTARMARRARGRIVWFSLNGGADMPDFLRRHIDDGRMAVVREPGPDGGCLVLHRGGRREVVVQPADIPATLHGLADFNIANAAACAIAEAQFPDAGGAGGEEDAPADPGEEKPGKE